MDIYQVDAFNNELFKGNPAAICPLDSWIAEDLMQQIAAENNLSETAFFVQRDAHFELRWFTPVSEIDLCGHATLATAHIIFTELNYAANEITFSSKSGILKVRKNGDWYTLNFPAEPVQPFNHQSDLEAIFKVPVTACYKGKWKLMIRIETEADLKRMKPDFYLMQQLEEDGIIVTAKGESVDFVSRFFVPKLGINEDPVTGSAHTLLIPYWAKELGKEKLNAIQLSERRGILRCENKGDRVEMSGQAVTYLKGKLTI